MNSYSITWTSQGLGDLMSCVEFVMQVSYKAAIELREEIDSSVSGLSTFPERNPVFKMPKSFPYVLRKMIVKKRYIVLYSVENDEIVIYRVLDARKKFSYIIY